MNLDNRQTLTFEQYMHRLEEWSSRDQLLECLTTITRFYATGYTVSATVEWLKLRESILADPEGECGETEEYRDRGEGFGA